MQSTSGISLNTPSRTVCVADRSAFTNDEDLMGGFRASPTGTAVFDERTWNDQFETGLRLKLNMCVSAHVPAAAVALVRGGLDTAACSPRPSGAPPQVARRHRAEPRRVVRLPRVAARPRRRAPLQPPRPRHVPLARRARQRRVELGHGAIRRAVRIAHSAGRGVPRVACVVACARCRV